MIDIVLECEKSEYIGIGGHIRPDGDCIGATLALSLYLKKRFPDKRITVFMEEPPKCFACIEGIYDFNTTFVSDVNPDTFIVVDTEPSRLGNAESFFQNAKKTINIDHHISNKDGSGMVNYVVPTASSASELIYNLIDDAYLDCEIATALYLGIAHDTGVFKYSNTSPETMRIIAKLLEYDFNFPELLDKTFFEKTYTQNIALSRIVLESRRFLENRVIFGFMNRRTMAQMQIESEDFDGVINQLRITAGVECAIFMHQMNACTYKVSMRSCGMIDVSAIAVSFGGGGHVRASGFYTKGEPEEILQKILLQIEEQFQKYEVVDGRNN